MPGYGSVAGGNLKFAGVDQGIDFTGAGPVYSLGDGVITRVVRSGSGWPGEGAVLNYRITSGPAAGRYVYVAEDFAPRQDLRQGSPVRRGDLLGQATGSGKAPGIETGWAQPSGIPVAPHNGRQPTALGQNFLAFVLGSPPGTGNITTTSPRGGTQTFKPGGGEVPQSGKGRQDVLGSAVDTPVSTVKGAVDTVESVGKFLGKLTDPNLWLRGLQIIAGGGLALLGLTLLVKQVGLGVPTPPLPSRAVSTADDYAEGFSAGEGYAQTGASRREEIPAGPVPVYDGKARSSDPAYDEIPF